jgi:hypothetical protein
MHSLLDKVGVEDLVVVVPLNKRRRAGTVALEPATYLSKDFAAAAVGGLGELGGAWESKHARDIQGSQVQRHLTAEATKGVVVTTPACV